MNFLKNSFTSFHLDLPSLVSFISLFSSLLSLSCLSSLCLLSLSCFSVSLCLNVPVCLSVPISVCCCGGCCCGRGVWSWCVRVVWCGTLCIQNVPVCTSTTPACGNTYGHGTGTHGDVWNVHTGARFERIFGERSKCVCVGKWRGQRDTPTTTSTHCTPVTHKTHNEETHNTQHRTRKVASSVLLTKICPREVIT